MSKLIPNLEFWQESFSWIDCE